MSLDEMNDEGVYNCKSCSEEISVPIDVSAGPNQKITHDCPKCSHPSLIHVEVENDGDVRLWATHPLPKDKPAEPFDVVQEASEESFPASDSPAY